MNNKKAKTPKKRIFDNANRGVFFQETNVYFDFALRDTKYIRNADGSIHCIGHRKAYQEAKKEKSWK